MEVIGELIARALKTPDDDRALGMIGRKSRRCAGSSRCTRKSGAESRPRPSSRPAARWRGRFPASSRAGQVEMAGAVARRFEAGGVLLAEAGTGTGKTLAYLVPAILSRQRVLDLHRHQEPPGTDLLQGHPGAAGGARRAVHRDLHEGTRELPLPASARPAGRRDGSSPPKRRGTLAGRSRAIRDAR